MVALATSSRFFEPSLKQRFLDAIRVDAKAPLAYHQRRPPVMVRHGLVAREILPKDHWGIVGRPDLLARMTDREMATKTAADAEMTRQSKAGEWLQPANQIRFEIAMRMQREWERQDRAATLDH